MTEMLRATPLEYPSQPDEDHQRVLEALGQIEPPRESQRAIAKYQVQRALRFGFSKSQHIHCATDMRPGKTWAGNIRKVLHGKYGGVEGFEDADLELEATLQDTEEIIYDS